MSKWNLNALKDYIEQTQTDTKEGIGFFNLFQERFKFINTTNVKYSLF